MSEFSGAIGFVSTASSNDKCHEIFLWQLRRTISRAQLERSVIS